MKKVLFIDKLDYLSLPLVLFSKLFFNTIVFRDSISFFRKIKINKFFEKINIKWINYLNLDCKYYNSSLKYKFILEEKFIEDQIKNNLFINRFVKYFSLNKQQIKKLYLCLRHDLLQERDFDFNESTSLILIEKFFLSNNFKVYYLPFHPASYVLLKELKKKQLKIFGIHCFLFFVFRLLKEIFILTIYFFKNIFFKIFYFKRRNINSDKKNNNFDQNISSYSLAFFPHKSLRYGDAFRKSYLYDNNKNSELFREKVLTLFFEEIPKIEKRYFRLYKIPFLNIKALSSTYLTLGKTMIFFSGSISLKNFLKGNLLNKIFLHYLLFKFCFHFIKYNHILNQLRNLKTVYIHYDVLFPQAFILACDIKKIITISTQNRTIQYSYFSPLFYNYYLIAGDGFKKILSARGYLIDNYINVGLPRASLINLKHKVLNKKLERFIEIKKQKKLIVCYGLVCEDKFLMGGEDGTSESSTVQFTNDIFKLSKEFPSYYFIIRFKSISTIKVIPKDIILGITNSNNIEINQNFKNENSYKLAAISDLIIGKHTSIMEEAMAADKKVIYYDNENFLSTLDYVLNKINVVEKDFEGLKRRIRYIFDNKYDEDNEIKNFVNQYLCTNPKNDGFNMIKRVVKHSLSDSN